MKNVKIYTMVKNEADILEYWIIYHSNIVNFENLYIVDNDSNDNTSKILEYYKTMGIHTYKYSDYSKKGDYICNLINNTCNGNGNGNGNNCIAIPIDIDEFICLKKDEDYIVDADIIYEYIKNLKIHGRYSFLYYLASVNICTYYNNPLTDINHFIIVDNNISSYNNLNKKFFTGSMLLKLDHGNHKGIVKNIANTDTYVTNLVLLHFHNRGVFKMIEKCINDIKGLGYIKNIDNLDEIKNAINLKLPGYHNMISLYKYKTEGINSLLQYTENTIYISSFSNYVKKFKIIFNDDI